MNNMDRNICRTAVPAIIGAIVAWVTKEWAKLPANDLMYLTPLATTAYYTTVRFAEEKFPKASWLLGCLPVKHEVPVVPEPVAPEPVARKPRAKAAPKA
jgi:hypothetical protein